MIYACIGRRERGKTTLAYFMLRALMIRTVIDARRMIRQRDDRVIHENYVEGANEALIAEVIEARTADEVIYQPHEDDLQRAFRMWTKQLKQIVIEHPEQQIGILVDEASFYDLNDPSFQWLCKCGLRDYTHIFITAHQPKDIPTSIRSITDHWFVFHTTQQTDLDRIAEKSPETADAAMHLRDRGYVHWDDTIAKMQINMNASSWFIRLNEGV